MLFLSTYRDLWRVPHVPDAHLSTRDIVQQTAEAFERYAQRPSGCSEHVEIVVCTLASAFSAVCLLPVIHPCCPLPPDQKVTNGFDYN
jgi:hypothetical protein